MFFKKKVDKEEVNGNEFIEKVLQLQEDINTLIMMHNCLNQRLDAFTDIIEDLQTRDTDAIELKKTLLNFMDSLGYVNIRTNYDKRLGEVEDAYKWIDFIKDRLEILEKKYDTHNKQTKRSTNLDKS